jgi:hypothetical protein
MAICDHFVYIPQFGDGTASLNVAVAGSIVLHHFATWARMSEQERAGNKYVVTCTKGLEEKKRDPGCRSAPELELTASRAARRAGASASEVLCGPAAFGDGEAGPCD